MNNETVRITPNSRSTPFHHETMVKIVVVGIANFNSFGHVIRPFGGSSR